MSIRTVESMPEAYYVRWEELNRRREKSPTARRALADHEALSRLQWLAKWAEELHRPGGRSRWHIVANRPCGGEAVFLCRSASQGTTMVPAAHSMAHRFHNRTEAEAERREAMTRFLGLANWRLVQERTSCDLS